LPKSRLLEGAETFLAIYMARAIARAILGPKKSRPPLKVERERRALGKSILEKKKGLKSNYQDYS
jgi:hypothetical protein